jgi:hypothetical protein
MTCFAAHEKYGVDCMRTSCSNWLDKARNNRVLVAAKDGERTLHDIGQLFTPALSRMRICQLVNDVYSRIRQQT